MFDVDKAIAAYFRDLTEKKFISRECRDELESHLRDDFEEGLGSGLDPETAFRSAVRHMGTPEEILGEYFSLYSKNKRQQWLNVLSYYFDRRVVMRLMIGFGTGMVFMLAGVLLEGGDLHPMMQMNGCFIVFGGAFGGLMIAFPLRTIWKSLVLALTGREAVQSAYLDAAAVFKAYGELAILSGFVGVIFGVVHVLQHLGRLETIGLGLAVALSCLLYGVLAKFFIGKALQQSFLTRAYPVVVESGKGSGNPSVRVA